MPARVWLAVAGIALGIQSYPTVSAGSVVVTATAAAACLAFRRRTQLTVAATFLLAAAAGWSAAAFDGADGAALRARAELFPRCIVEGRVLEHAGGLGTLIALEAADCAPARGAAVMTSSLDLAPGTAVVARGWLSPLERDEGFERARSAAGADAGFVIDELSAGEVEGAAHRAAASFRASLADAASHLEVERQGLVLGMAIGDTSQLPEPVLEELRRAGLTHLLAVSGSNVAIVMGVVALALRRAPLNVRVATCAVALGFYILVVGPEPSVLRAGAMGAIALLALWRGVPTQTFNLLGLALVIVLLLRPGLLHSAGLHLSAAATAGIVVWANPLAERFPRLPRSVALAFGASLAAQFAVAPVLLATFGEISLVAPLANVLAFPVVAPITVLSLAAGAVSLLTPGPARLLMSAISPLADWVIDVGSVTGGTTWASAAIPTWTALPTAALVIEAARRTLRQERAGVDPVPRDDAGMGDWLWRLNAADGKELRATQTFEDKAEAEAWLGAEWQSLADEGAESVSLLQGDKVVYTMGLGEE